MGVVLVAPKVSEGEEVGVVLVAPTRKEVGDSHLTAESSSFWERVRERTKESADTHILNKCRKLAINLCHFCRRKVIKSVNYRYMYVDLWEL